MPFPFTLPTTSSTSLTDHLSSPTHPSLPLTATTHRSVLRDALKKHKRLSTSAQQSHLSTVNEALNNYIPYLILLRDAVIAQAASPVSIVETSPLKTEWRPTLSRSPPGRSESERVAITNLDAELAFVLQTAAYVQVLQSRIHVFTLYATSPPPPQDQRATAIAAAMRCLLDAQSIHAFVLSLSLSSTSTTPVDITPATISALSSLALAEATLITVLKDDPYVAAVVEARDKESKEWMVSAPSIPKVRAHLFARLCLASADHAAKAAGLLAQGGAKTDETLLKYVNDLRRTARAKAARWLGVDAELAGKTAEAIAWIRGGRKELGFLVSSTDEESGTRRGFRGLKQNWAEKKEDRKVLKRDNESWSLDAGKLEEGRVLEWLERKWVRENDAVNVQPIPSFEPLLASMPSGREYHTPKKYNPPTLDQDSLIQMRAPLDPDHHAFKGTEADSGDEADSSMPAPVGAFPGTSLDYRTDSPAYY